MSASALPTATSARLSVARSRLATIVALATIGAGIVGAAAFVSYRRRQRSKRALSQARKLDQKHADQQRPRSIVAETTTEEIAVVLTALPDGSCNSVVEVTQTVEIDVAMNGVVISEKEMASLTSAVSVDAVPKRGNKETDPQYTLLASTDTTVETVKTTVTYDKSAIINDISDKISESMTEEVQPTFIMITEESVIVKELESDHIIFPKAPSSRNDKDKTIVVADKDTPSLADALLEPTEEIAIVQTVEIFLIDDNSKDTPETSLSSKDEGDHTTTSESDYISSDVDLLSVSMQPDQDIDQLINEEHNGTNENGWKQLTSDNGSFSSQDFSENTQEEESRLEVLASLKHTTASVLHMSASSELNVNAPEFVPLTSIELSLFDTTSAATVAMKGPQDVQIEDYTSQNEYAMGDSYAMEGEYPPQEDYLVHGDYAAQEVATSKERRKDHSKRIRCAYWPRCRQGTECMYWHPIQKCKSENNRSHGKTGCLYGTRCLFFHQADEEYLTANNIHWPYPSSRGYGSPAVNGQHNGDSRTFGGASMKSRHQNFTPGHQQDNSHQSGSPEFNLDAPEFVPFTPTDSSHSAYGDQDSVSVSPTVSNDSSAQQQYLTAENGWPTLLEQSSTKESSQTLNVHAPRFQPDLSN